MIEYVARLAGVLPAPELVLTVPHGIEPVRACPYRHPCCLGPIGTPGGLRQDDRTQPLGFDLSELRDARGPTGRHSARIP
jgi:hypothetical protein